MYYIHRPRISFISFEATKFSDHSPPLPGRNSTSFTSLFSTILSNYDLKLIKRHMKLISLQCYEMGCFEGRMEDFSRRWVGWRREVEAVGEVFRISVIFGTFNRIN